MASTPAMFGHESEWNDNILAFEKAAMAAYIAIELKYLAYECFDLTNPEGSTTPSAIQGHAG